MDYNIRSGNKGLLKALPRTQELLMLHLLPRSNRAMSNPLYKSTRYSRSYATIRTPKLPSISNPGFL
jgi:hypothetical protein